MERDQGGTGSRDERLKENELADQNKIEYEECVEQSPVRHRIHRQQRKTYNIEHCEISLFLCDFESSLVIFHIRREQVEGTVRQNHHTETINFFITMNWRSWNKKRNLIG